MTLESSTHASHLAVLDASSAPTPGVGGFIYVVVLHAAMLGVATPPRLDTRAITPNEPTIASPRVTNPANRGTGTTTREKWSMTTRDRYLLHQFTIRLTSPFPVLPGVCLEIGRDSFIVREHWIEHCTG
jgi:hypothetical protein